MSLALNNWAQKFCLRKLNKPKSDMKWQEHKAPFKKKQKKKTSWCDALAGYMHLLLYAFEKTIKPLEMRC